MVSSAKCKVRIMIEQVILWYIPMHPATAERMQKAHTAAFKLSGCKQCAGECCKDCAENEGYLHRDNLKPGQIRYLKGRYGWTKAKGFSGETGCNLPSDKRSTTCVSFWCGQKLNGFMSEYNTPGTMLKGHARHETLDRLKSFQSGMSHLINHRDERSIKIGVSS